MTKYKDDPTDDYELQPNAEDNFYNSDPTQEALDYVKELEDKIRFAKKELKELHLSEDMAYQKNIINKIINKIK